MLCRVFRCMYRMWTRFMLTVVSNIFQGFYFCYFNISTLCWLVLPHIMKLKVNGLLWVRKCKTWRLEKLKKAEAAVIHTHTFSSSLQVLHALLLILIPPHCWMKWSFPVCHCVFMKTATMHNTFGFFAWRINFYCIIFTFHSVFSSIHSLHSFLQALD